MSGITTVNSLAANIEINPYWADGYDYRNPPTGGAIHNVKVLATWWYSTDGLYAGPHSAVSASRSFEL